MKKITAIFFVSTLFFITQGYAQNTKPTKEQTIEFITNYLSKDLDVDCMDGSGIFRNDGEREIIFDGFTMNYTYTYRGWFRGESKSIASSDVISGSIDFAKVEKAQIVYWIGNVSKVGQNNCYTVSLRVEYKGSSKPENFLVNRYVCTGECNPAEIEKKILQAINHLRKLAGAPEPINFE